jgi:hypothetical protein
MRLGVFTSPNATLTSVNAVDDCSSFDANHLGCDDLGNVNFLYGLFVCVCERGDSKRTPAHTRIEKVSG